MSAGIGTGVGRGGVVAEIAVPSNTAGWAIVGCHEDYHGHSVLSGVLPALHGAGIATVSIELPHAAAAAAARVRDVGTSVRDELAGELPVAYLAAGRAATAGWAASLGGDLSGVLAWNPAVRGAWSAAKRVEIPSLLMVDARTVKLTWQLIGVSALGRVLRDAQIELAEGDSQVDGGVVAAWYWDRILSPVPVPRPARCRRGGQRTRAARAGVAVALAVPALGALAAPSTSALTLPDFGTGAKLRSAEISGDSAARPAGATVRKDSAGKRLSAGQIGGDGGVRPAATGSDMLIDGSGLKWFLNDNITFSTSSSASAAMSEASFTHAVAATTLNGGTVMTTLGDAYDGYQSLCVVNDNTVPGECETGNPNFEIYNKNGPATADPNCNGRQFDFNTQTINGLSVSRKVFVPDNDSFARWLDIVTNPGASPAEVTLGTGNNLGSAAATTITGDSSGNTTPTTADTWVATFENFTGATSSDVRLGHVLGGAGAATGLAGLGFTNGDRNPFWGYTFTLAPGQTKIIMNYGVGQPTRALAASKSAELATLSDPNQLNCMTPAEIAQVVNFAVPPTGTTADSFTTKAGTTLNQAAPGVLANDQVTGEVTAQLASGPAHAASFTLHPDGSFSYTPTAGFAGTDSFTYQAKGLGGGLSVPTKVTLTVTGAAPAFTSAGKAPFTVGKAGSFTISSTGLPAAKLTAGALPKGLTFKDNGNGTATISGTPAAGTHGNRVVTITAANGAGTNATQALTLAISAGAPPTAASYSYKTREGNRLAVRAPGVLTKSRGVQPLSAVLVGGSTRGGSVSLQGNGSFTFTPKKGFSGRAGFSYTAEDLDGGTSPVAKVTVTVTATSNNLALIRKIRRSANGILASYRMIALSANSILDRVIVPDVAGQVNKLLSQAAALANQAEKLVAGVNKNIKGPKALSNIAAARRKAAEARALAAQARLLAVSGTDFAR